MERNCAVKHTEREFKWSLANRSDWEQIQAILGRPCQELHQQNIYFDSEDGFFASRRCMLRLRRENGRLLFVYKRGLSMERGCFSALEIEEELTEAEFEALLAGNLDWAGQSQVGRQIIDDNFKGKLRPVGDVRNLRLVWPIELAGLAGEEKFELDCTTFNGEHTEYELELETWRAAQLQSLVESWAERAGIRLTEQTLTKYERFLYYNAVKAPLISCLMPIYNCAATLEHAVQSIKKQTFKSWELILVDDGSTDATLEIARNLAAADPRIRVFSLKHSGITAVLNFAFSQSRARFIARMDGDDISHPERFAKQMLYLSKHPEVAAVGCKVRIFPKQELTEGMKRYERWLNKACQPEILDRDIFVESPLVHPSVIIRRAALEEAGLYEDGCWPEDYHLWLRLWLRGFKMAKVDQVLFFWRDLPNRLTRVDKRCSHEALRNLKVSFLLRAFFPSSQEERGLRSLSADKRQLIVWGAGPNGKALVKTLRAHGFEPAFYTDILPARHGQIICGLKVLSLDELPEPQHFFLITAVGNPRSREEIRTFLQGRGWQEGRDFCCTAGISD
ncbi:MAG: glycosyltransferase [Candidatus Bruticola sp.]